MVALRASMTGRDACPTIEKEGDSRDSCGCFSGLRDRPYTLRGPLPGDTQWIP